MTGLDQDDQQAATLLREVWTELAPRYEPVGELGAGTIEGIEAELRAEFTEANPGKPVTVRLPPELVELYRLVDRSVRRGDDLLYGRSTFCGPSDPDDVLDRDPDEWQDRLAGIRRNGLWQPLGYGGDKYDLWICVDTSSPHWRKVIWTKDDTPHTDRELPASSTYEGLCEYLQHLAERSR